MGRITLLLFCFALPLSAQESREGSVDRNKDLPQIVKEISAEVERTKAEGEKVLVVWLIDNVTAFRASGQGKLLSDSMAASFSSDVYHSLFALGDPTEGLIAPTRDHSKIARGLEVLAKRPPDNRIKNCLLGVRVAAKSAARFRGKRFLVLHTPANGDNEEQLEETLKFLRKLRIRFYSVAGEAVYSDPYWKSVLGRISYFTTDTEKYRNLKFQLAGQESAYIEFPYGWPLHMIDPSYTVPSGFGYYALSRLATRTGGKYYVYHPGAAASSSFCQRYGCQVCSGRHAQCGAVFQSTKLDLVAPDLRSRDRVRQEYGRENLAIAVHRAWVRLQKKGILRGSSQLRLSGKRFREEKSRNEGASTGMISGSGWKSRRQEALRKITEVDKVLLEFLPVLEKFGPESALRVRATADAFHVHLLMLRFNFRQLALFSEEMARIMRRPAPSSPEFGSPVLEQYAGKRVIGYSYRNFFLCHGGKALRGVRFLGGPEVEKEKQHLIDVAMQVIDRHRSTPWEILARRAGFVILLPTVQAGTANQKNRPKPKSSGSGDNATATPNPNRPNRPNAGGGGSGGTATGD